MKPPLLLRLHLLMLLLLATIVTLVAAAPTITVSTTSCNDIVCPAVVIPLPKECSLRTSHQIPDDVCTCVWEPCSCGYSCRFPSCAAFNTTVTCPGEPCATKNCAYGCTNDYCSGCNGFCWEKPYTPNPTNPAIPTPSGPVTPITTSPPTSCGVCPAVVVPLPDGCQERNGKENTTSSCTCDWDQCLCKWQCSIPTPTCPNPVQCLIDPCATTKCSEGMMCISNYCGACTATCIPVEDPKPNDCPNPVQCAVDPCATMSCLAGTVCEQHYCNRCNATCKLIGKPITTSQPPMNCDGMTCVDPCVAMTCVTGNVCVKTDCCHATCTSVTNTNPTATNDTITCSYHGSIYTHGQTIDDGCNSCTCQRNNNSTSGSMICTARVCESSTAGIDNGTCIYNEQRYTWGQSIISTDGCNRCTCMQQGMACTVMACISSTGTTNNVTCSVDGRTYTPGQRTISLDGCNMCVCGQDGRIACTLMACMNNTATNIDITPMILVATTVVLTMIG